MSINKDTLSLTNKDTLSLTDRGMVSIKWDNGMENLYGDFFPPLMGTIILGIKPYCWTKSVSQPDGKLDL